MWELNLIFKQPSLMELRFAAFQPCLEIRNPLDPSMHLKFWFAYKNPPRHNQE